MSRRPRTPPAPPAPPLAGSASPALLPALLPLLLPVLLPVLFLALLLVGCAPGARGPVPPTVQLAPGGVQLLAFDPPGVGETAGGRLRLALELLVSNPNPLALEVTELDALLVLGDRPAAELDAPGGIALPAGGSARVPLEARLPLAEAPGLLARLAGLLAGTPLDYRLDVGLGVRVLGTVQRIPTVTVARGALPPLQAATPLLRFDAERTELLELSLTRVRLQLAFQAENPGVVGYRVSSPGVTLTLNGAPLVDTELASLALPAGSATDGALDLAFSPLQLGVGLLGQLQQGGAGVEVALRGPLDLVIPGIADLRLEPRELLRGALR